MRGIRLSSSEIEAQLALHRLDFPQADPSAEALRLPSMAEIFADLCNKADGCPPAQAHFVDAFARRYRSMHSQLLEPQHWSGVEARLMRAHPSFVRERHLEAMLVENGLVCARSTSADQEHGIDLVVITGRYALRLSTYVGTPGGHQWRSRKLRGRAADGVYLDVPLEDGEEHYVGKYRLYGQWHARAIAELVPQLELARASRYVLKVPPSYLENMRFAGAGIDDLPF